MAGDGVRADTEPLQEPRHGDLEGEQRRLRIRRLRPRVGVGVGQEHGAQVGVDQAVEGHAHLVQRRGERREGSGKIAGHPQTRESLAAEQGREATGHRRRRHDAVEGAVEGAVHHGAQTGAQVVAGGTEDDGPMLQPGSVEQRPADVDDVGVTCVQKIAQAGSLNP